MTREPRYEGGSAPKPLIEISRYLRRLLQFLAPHRRQLGLFIGLLLIATVVPLAVPPLIGRTVELIAHRPEVSQDGYLHQVLWLCLALLLIQTVLLVIRYAREVQSKKLGETLAREIRIRLFDHLLDLSARFYDRERVGALVNRVLEESKVLEELFYEGLGAFLLAPISFTGMFVIMLFLDWRLALLALVPIPFMILTMVTAVRRLRGLNRAHRDSTEDLASYLQQRFSGIRTIQILGQESAERDRFREQTGQLADLKVDIARMLGRYLPVMGWISSASVVLVLGYAGVLTREPGMAIGTLVTFLSYVMIFYGPVIEMTRAHYLLQNMALSAERIFEILDHVPEIRDGEGAVEIPDGCPSIRFDRVSFQYEAGKPVFQDVSFSIPAGRCVGIRGKTGAGKSTLARLMVRMFDPTAGEIFIGPHDVRKYRLASLRSVVSMVLQDDFLFDDTVRNNVTYGFANASEADVESVLRLAQAWDFVRRLPCGLETPIGERGVLLSSGEKQKLCMARVLMRKPQVLILDEATSAMDVETERQVLTDLRRALEGRTVLVISHRPSALEICSEVLEVIEGRIVGL